MTSEKTVNTFTREMIEAFGLDQLAIRITDIDGNLIKQTDNWIDEAELIRREKQIKSRKSEELKNKGMYGYKRY